MFLFCFVAFYAVTLNWKTKDKQPVMTLPPLKLVSNSLESLDVLPSFFSLGLIGLPVTHWRWPAIGDFLRYNVSALLEAGTSPGSPDTYQSSLCLPLLPVDTSLTELQI